jgi:capsular polysaccharide biosynthesis protein
MKGEVAKVEDENQSLHQFATKAIDGPTAYSPSLAGQIIAEQKAQAAVDGDRARVAALDAQISTTRQQLSDVPKSGMNVGAIRALRDTEEAQYSALALRLSNAQANSAEANSLGSVVVIDRAETAEPYLLGTNLLLALFALVAVGVSIGAGYLAEAVNPRFISPGDVESFYGRPVIGSINAV